MKKVYSHTVGFVEHLGFQLIGINLENISKKEEPEALEQGFLLDIKKEEEIWYQCRSTRVNVESYINTPYNGEWAYSTDLNAFKRLYKRFVTKRQFYVHPGDIEVNKRDKLIAYSINDVVHGISKIRTYTNTFECNLFVHDDTKSKPSESDCIAGIAALQKAYDDAAYQRSRVDEYPSIGDQLDMIYHNGDGGATFQAAIKAVKDKYPKE